MSNKDAAITRPIATGGPIPDDTELTPEQRAFAEVLGREIARFWKGAHRDETSVSQSAPHEARAAASATTDRLASPV
jgi:hypothetical protein